MLSVSGPQAFRISGTICTIYGIVNGLNYSFKYFLKNSLSESNTYPISVDEFYTPLSMILTGVTILLISEISE